MCVCGRGAAGGGGGGWSEENVLQAGVSLRKVFTPSSRLLWGMFWACFIITLSTPTRIRTPQHHVIASLGKY